jgi:hypothetical protein
LRFEGARAEPVTAWCVAISRDNQRAPIDQTSPTGVAVLAIRRGSFPVAAHHADDCATSSQSLDLPAGNYWMQPFVNVYTDSPR